MDQLVSIICTCYNHASFVSEALLSAIQQDHPKLEIIIIDNGSVDGSKALIKKLIVKYPFIKFLDIPEPIPYPKAFNKGLSLSKGQFIVDLSADDILLPNRVSAGLVAFNNQDESYGVNFCDGWIINKDGKTLGTHYKRDTDGKLSEPVPQGNIFSHLVERYFILSPTMMIRRSVFDYMNGYDESLDYEDFDFWVRSSRIYKYCFSDQVLIKRRKLKNSFSKKQYRWRSRILDTNFRVCEKALYLCQNSTERSLLRKRVIYEWRKAMQLGRIELFLPYLKLIIKVNNGS